MRIRYVDQPPRQITYIPDPGEMADRMTPAQVELTETVRPLYDDLGVLEYEDRVGDGDVDWALLENPQD